MKPNCIPPLETKIEDVIFNIFDTETTGNNTKQQDKPIEIAAVRWAIHKGFFEIPKSWLVDPKMPIHPSAIAVHGLLDEDVEGKPELEEVLPEIHEYIKDNVLVAHNIEFDLNMLPTFKELPNVKIDSLRFVRHIFKIGDLGHKNQDLTSHKCQELRYWLGLKVDTMGLMAHRAAADILVTGEVFNSALKKYLELTGGKTLKDLVEFINAPILIEKINFGKFKGMAIEDIAKEEAKKSNNYFVWLLKEVKNGKMQIDPDLKYTIEYHMKNNNIDPVSILVEEKAKTWKDIAAQAKRRA